MSVARVAQAEGVNSHQVFQWRRAYRQGALGELGCGSATLLPVILREDREQTSELCGKSEPAVCSGAIHIEFPGRATIMVENGADMRLLRAVLESLRQ